MQIVCFSCEREWEREYKDHLKRNRKTMVDFLRTSFDKHPFHCPCCGSQLEYCADIKTKSKVGSRLLDTTVRLTYYNGVGCVRR